MDDPARADLYPPTDPVLLAGLWGAVSAAHRALEACHRYFDVTDADSRLADQLTLLPVLIDWIPASEPEAIVLTKALRGYADERSTLSADREADTAVGLIKQMLRERGRIGIPPTP